MTLEEIVRDLDRADLRSAIYVTDPWQPSAPAVTAKPRPDGGVPDDVFTAGHRLFLEVSAARALIENLSAILNREPTNAEKCARLIEYANWLDADETTPLPLPAWKFPLSMMIYCDGCGKYFDIVVATKATEHHPCPACGKVHAFAFENFVTGALKAVKKMRRGPRGR